MSSLLTIKLSRYQLMLVRDLAYDEMRALDRLDWESYQEEQAIKNNTLHLQEVADKIDKVLKDRF